MYPQLDSSDDPSDEMIESCSKCYVATMPCADLVTTDTEQMFYYKTETSDGYCEEKKGNLSYRYRRVANKNPCYNLENQVLERVDQIGKLGQLVGASN